MLYHCPAGRLGHRVTATDLETAAEAGKDAASTMHTRHDHGHRRGGAVGGAAAVTAA